MRPLLLNPPLGKDNSEGNRLLITEFPALGNRLNFPRAAVTPLATTDGLVVGRFSCSFEPELYAESGAVGETERVGWRVGARVVEEEASGDFTAVGGALAAAAACISPSLAFWRLLGLRLSFERVRLGFWVGVVAGASSIETFRVGDAKSFVFGGDLSGPVSRKKVVSSAVSGFSLDFDVAAIDGSSRASGVDPLRRRCGVWGRSRGFSQRSSKGMGCHLGLGWRRGRVASTARATRSGSSGSGLVCFGRV